MPPIERISAASFKQFGHVCRPGEGLTKSIRDGRAVLTRTPAEMAHGEEAPELAIDFYQVGPENDILHAMQAERHPHSSQMFIPMSVDRYLVLVWPDHPDRGPEPRAFVAGPQDVVVYGRGVWHHGIVALGREAIFASTMWKTGGGVDTEFLTLSQPFALDLAEVPS